MEKTILKVNQKTIVKVKLFSQVLLRALFISFLLICNFKITNAEEKEAPPNEEGAKDNKEEKSDKKEDTGGFIKKDEYLELNSSIEQLSAKVKTKNENLKKLLSDKDHIKESLAFKKIVKEIEVEYRDIKDLMENIEKKKTVLRHRFPEKSFIKNGEKSKENKAEEISTDSIMDKKIEQLIKLVEVQYKGFITPKKEKLSEEQQRNPASQTETTVEANQNPEDFSRPLILKK